jgi:AcrR family transcriptional regulator
MVMAPRRTATEDAPTAPPQLPGARTGRDPSRAIKRGPSRLPPEVVAATQRDRLFDGLVHTVAQKGYANARVGDICLAAGVTRPAFYALFEGKEDAFLATYRYGTDLLWSMVESAHRAMPEWRHGVRNGIGVLLTILASVPTFATMAIVEIDAVGANARAERDVLLRRFHGFFAHAPRSVNETPRDAVGHDELVGCVVGGIYATIQRQVASGEVDRLPRLLPGLTYFALVPFIGPAQAQQTAQDHSQRCPPG